MAINVEFMGQKITPASGEAIEINYPLRGRGNGGGGGDLIDMGCCCVAGVLPETPRQERTISLDDVPDYYAKLKACEPIGGWIIERVEVYSGGAKATLRQIVLINNT